MLVVCRGALGAAADRIENLCSAQHSGVEVDAKNESAAPHADMQPV